jgi:nucleotide-binding universal stress UspA family protein
MMSGSAQPRVVVGYDGTANGRTAVQVAAREAARRDRPLLILTVVQPEIVGVLPRARYPEGAIGAAAELLAVATDIVRASGPPTVHDSEVLFGDPVAELVSGADGAELLVVGRGRASPAQTLLGSVAIGVMAEATCPVLVVGDSTGRQSDGGTVVVGVDGRPESVEALEVAFAEAALSGATVVAVHAWHLPTSVGPGDMLPLVYASTELESDETSVLHDAVRPFRERYPCVPVSEVATEAPALRALLDAARGARMLVVGSRGRGPLKGLLLGSLGQSAVRHSSVPVLIARTHES